MDGRSRDVNFTCTVGKNELFCTGLKCKRTNLTFTLQALLAALPECNRLLVQWVFVHMGHVISNQRVNKMTLQNVSIVLSPTMRISHRVLNCIFEHHAALFSLVQLTRYVPPISGPGGPLPQSPRAIAEEMRKQESLLAELHNEISSGATISRAREEQVRHRVRHCRLNCVVPQLWEQQRIVTQLKRNLRLARAGQGEARPPDQVGPLEPWPQEEQLDFALQTPGPQPDTAPQLDITQEEEESGKVNQESSKEEELTGREVGGEAGQEGNTLPEGIEKVVEEGSQEHRVTVQVHREGAGHVTVIQLSQEVETGGAAPPLSQDPATPVSIAPVTPPPLASAPSPTKPTFTVLPDSPAPALSPGQAEADPALASPGQAVTFSSPLPGRTPPSAIPLLPPPPSASKAGKPGRHGPARALLPPDNKLKSKSLPRGLPRYRFNQPIFLPTAQLVSCQAVRCLLSD